MMFPVWIPAALALVALIAVSAFFSSSETAIMSAGRVRLIHAAERGRSGARLALKLIERPGSVLATILVGNNLVNVAAAAVATVVWGPLWATVIVTLLLLVLAEVTPKTLAASLPEVWAMRVAAPVRMFEVVLKPISWMVTSITNLLLIPLLGRREKRRRGLNRQELLTAMRLGAREGELEPSETRMTHEILSLKDTPVAELAVPLESVNSVPESASFAEVMEIAIRARHTRYPVYRADPEDLIGVVLVKDLLEHVTHTDDSWRRHVRPLNRVDARLEADELMRDMQIQRFHLAVVVDPADRPLGIITLEDILEEIVGDILDETDDSTESIQELSPHRFLVPGEIEVDDLCKVINVDLGHEDQHLTLRRFFDKRVKPRGAPAGRSRRLKVGSTRIIERSRELFEIRILHLIG